MSNTNTDNPSTTEQNTGSGVSLFGSDDHQVSSTTEEGHLVEAPSYGEDRGVVLVSTDEGLFPMRPFDTDLANHLREVVINELSMPAVKVRGDDVYFTRDDGEEEKIGKRNRYDGSGYDPSRQNPGAIEIVHEYQDSGNLVLTDQNPDARIYDYQNHGAKLVNLLKQTQDPDAGTVEERTHLRDKILLQLKAAWGDSIAIDLDGGNFEPVGDDINAEKCAYFKERVRAVVMDDHDPNAAVSGGSQGLPDL